MASIFHHHVVYVFHHGLSPSCHFCFLSWSIFIMTILYFLWPISIMAFLYFLMAYLLHHVISGNHHGLSSSWHFCISSWPIFIMAFLYLLYFLIAHLSLLHYDISTFHYNYIYRQANPIRLASVPFNTNKLKIEYKFNSFVHK